MHSALLFTLYARNYFRVVGSSLGSTPRLATPRALDIAQLAERLTVVDVLLQLYWALPIVINWSPVRFRLSRHASSLLIYFRVGLMTKWRNGSGEFFFGCSLRTPSSSHHFSPFSPPSSSHHFSLFSSPSSVGFQSRRLRVRFPSWSFSRCHTLGWFVGFDSLRLAADRSHWSRGMM